MLVSRRQIPYLQDSSLYFKRNDTRNTVVCDYCISSVVSFVSSLNRWSRSLGLFDAMSCWKETSEIENGHWDWMAQCSSSIAQDHLLEKNGTTYIFFRRHIISLEWHNIYGVATVSRIDKIIGLFCRISSLLRALLQKRPTIWSILLTHPPHIVLRRHIISLEWHNISLLETIEMLCHSREMICLLKIQTLCHSREMLSHSSQNTCCHIHNKRFANLCTTGWQKPVGCLIFTGHFPEKAPRISGSFVERDVQLKAFLYLRHPVIVSVCSLLSRYRSLLQNIVSFLGLFCKRDLFFQGAY